MPEPPTSVSHMVEEVVGCKWSVTVLALITSGVSRPGAMQRRVRGLTAKVLNERLKKLLRFGIIERQMFAGHFLVSLGTKGGSSDGQG